MARNKWGRQEEGGGGGTSFEDLGYQPFDATRTAENPYEIGDVVIYDGSLYKFTASHSGTWIGTDTTATSVEELIKEKADADKVLTKEEQTLSDAEKAQVLDNLDKISEADRKFSGKTLIKTQEEFDALITAINRKESVDVVLANREFVLKTPVNIIETSNEINISIVGTENTVIKGNNDVYYRSDADSTYASETHYRCQLKHSVNPFSVCICDDKLVELNSVKNIKITGKYLMTDGTDIPTSGGNIDNILIPKFECGYNEGDIVFGYIESNWSKVRFSIVEQVELNDNYYYNVSIETYNTAGTSRSINDNVNRLYTQYGHNVVSVFNVSGNGVWFDDTYIYIPLNTVSTEVVNLENTNQAFLDNLSFRINSNYGKIKISGVEFKNIEQGFYITHPGSSSVDLQVDITNCVFRNILGLAIRQDIRNTTRASAKLSGCKFIDTCLSYNTSYYVSDYMGNGYVPAVIFEGNEIDNTNSNYGNCRCFDFNADAVIKNCTVRNCAGNSFIVRNGRIEIVDCTFFHDDHFLSDISRSIRDCGLLYVGQLTATDWQTNNLHKCTIRHCKLFNGFGYYGTHHGIYCDNGRTDVLVESNLIFNVSNKAFTARKSNETYASKNVVLRNNIMNGSITLNGASALVDEEIPVADNNVLLGRFGNLIDARNTGKNVISDDFNADSYNMYVGDSVNCPEGTIDLVVSSSRKKDEKRLVIENNWIANNQGNYHLIRYKVNTINLYDVINIAFTAHYRPLRYEITLSTSTYNTSQVSGNSRFCKMVAYSQEAFYDFIKCYKWVEDGYVNLAICAESFREDIGMQGGVFEIEAPADCLNSIEISCNNAFSTLPSNISSKSSFINSVYVIRDITHTMSATGLIFARQTQNPFVLNSNVSYVNIPICITYAVDYSRHKGLITKYGVYISEGTTELRPTPSGNDKGFVYYDTTLNKHISWNGTAWVNLDGTALS